MTEQPTLKDISVTQLENGVFEVAVLAATRTAIDEIFSALSWIRATPTPDDVVRYVVINRAKTLPPLAYLGRRSYEWLRANASHRTTRTALILGGDVLVNAMLGIFQTGRRYSRSNWQWKLFRHDEYDAAVAWALSDKL